jgi:predicted RNA binding protein YcfA (HicA-like mRNA interferase family)
MTVPKMPRVSGNKLISALPAAGYVHRQGKGSHVVIRSADNSRGTVVKATGDALHPEALQGSAPSSG